MNADLKNRRKIADKYLKGRGIEIGAGPYPAEGKLIDELHVIDKRSRSELKELFNADIPYDVRTLEEARSLFPDGADFVVAHQVLEHCHNPIQTLMEWLSLLHRDGTLFLGVPVESAAFESRRPRTPIEHLLDDFIFARSDTAYDSAQHVYSFIHGWAAVRPGDFWYAQKDVTTYIDVCLSEGLRVGHDFHWHTFTRTTIRQTIEAAFWFTNSSVEFMYDEEYEGSALIVCRRPADRPDPARPHQRLSPVEPGFVRDYRNRLLSALTRLR